MPEISLTEFVDFVIKSGTQRITEVKRLKAQHAKGYHPSRDYWRKLRDGIVDMHQQGRPKRTLDALVAEITDGNKAKNYPVVTAAYKKWLGRKEVAWFQPARARWEYQDLAVRVNPELGLDINGAPHLIKLYFKDPKLTTDRIAVIRHMMCDALATETGPATLALLDVRHSKLHCFEAPEPTIAPLLEGEALAFCRMYEGV